MAATVLPVIQRKGPLRRAFFLFATIDNSAALGQKRSMEDPA